MSKEIVHCAEAPAAIGPYSHAVKANGMVYVSGAIGFDMNRVLVPGGVGPQARRALENIKAIVTTAGSDLSKAVKCTVLLTDMAHFAEVNAVYAEFFPVDPPARACYAVVGLPAGALVEIECTLIA